MRLTIDIQNDSELERLLSILKKLDLEFNIIKKRTAPRKAVKKELPIIKGDHSIDPFALAGIWKDNPITLEEIREKAWRTPQKI